MRRITISEFLQAFPFPSLHHREPVSDDVTPWVFWSGSENRDEEEMMIHEMIISCFSSNTKRMAGGYICQFWAPVGGGRILSTSGQPFAVGGYLSNEFAMYRQYPSENHMDVVGGTFLNRLSCVNQLPSDTGLHVSVTLPICFGGFSTCIGVLEFTTDAAAAANLVVLDVIVNLKEAGLDVFPVQDLIPYKTINGLKLVKDETDVALKVVCGSHNVALAQVWIACVDKSYVKETRRLLALKLTGYVFDVRYTTLHTLCDAFPSILARSTLEDYTSRFVPEVSSDLLIGLELDGTFLPESRSVTICLKSDDTGDFDYVFEFIWTKGGKIPTSVFGVISTLKKCLPRFKFASGEQIREDFLRVMFVGKPTSNVRPNSMLRLVPRKRSSGAEENHLHGRKIRKANDSSSINIQSEKDNGTETMLSLEADYGYGIIKFHLPVWQATYANVEKQISNKLGGTSDLLEYLDEDEEWICVETEEEMGDCITSSRIRASTEEEEMGDCLRIQLRVTLSHKWLIGPFGILSIE